MSLPDSQNNAPIPLQDQSNPASKGKRFTAGLIDLVFIGMIGYAIEVISLVVWWLYFTILESSTLQGTFGKRIFGLKVVDYEGQRIGWGRANGRYWSKIISTIILYIGFMMIGWTERKQGLHDKIAETYVIRSR